MKTERRGVGILRVADEDMLKGFSTAEGFPTHSVGAGSLLEFLSATTTASGSRVAVAITSGAHISGYLCAVPPSLNDRLSVVDPSVELFAFEVGKSVRRQGVFRAMFEAAFRDVLEEQIIYVVADPVRWADRESALHFRRRMTAILGALGFVPVPDAAAHASRGGALFVRVGRGVNALDVAAFFDCLHAERRPSIAIAMCERGLRNLVRHDLERQGFPVVSVSRSSGSSHADVVITDREGPVGTLVTVRLGDQDLDAPVSRGGTLWYPVNDLEHLGAVLRRELLRVDVH